MKASSTVPTVRLASSVSGDFDVNLPQPIRAWPPANGHSRQCCRAASAPRRCAPPVRLGLPPTGPGLSHAVAGRRQGEGADHRVRGRELSTVRRYGRGRGPSSLAVAMNITLSAG
jgi:hypothetical protein